MADLTLLDIARATAAMWAEQIYPMTSRNLWPDLPEKCHEHVREITEIDRRVLADCRKEHAAAMQHGRDAFHEFVALALEEHIIRDATPSLHMARHIQRPAKDRLTACIGRWGMSNGDVAQRFDGIESAVRENESFEISNPWGSSRVDKLSLNANSTSASVVLACPPGFNSMRIGFVKHGLKTESGVFTVDGEEVRTHDRKASGDTRVREYTPASLHLPAKVVVRVKELEPAARIEITDIVCG